MHIFNLLTLCSLSRCSLKDYAIGDVHVRGIQTVNFPLTFCNVNMHWGKFLKTTGTRIYFEILNFYEVYFQNGVLACIIRQYSFTVFLKTIIDL